MLKTRVVTALLLLGGFLAVLFLLPFAGWLLFASLVAGLGAWEWAGLLRLSGALRRAYAAMGFALCAFLGWLAFDAASGQMRQPGILMTLFALAGIFWLMIVPFWLRARWSIGKGPGALVGLIVVLPACLALMQLRTVSPLLLLAAMAFVWLADIAAYFSGRAYGRHKLAPSISPGKSWEGVAGAAILVVPYGLLVGWAAGALPGSAAALLTLLFALEALLAVSILGDLFESLAKRQANIKDSGTLLPGHGGVLDRIDSLTSTLPLIGLTLLLREASLG
ncbi:MAG: phosphatidate cytidylyltransferase [Betaproteobacteria bacterium]|nr:phosphatidate cytidylyltransferase [Betaproteobacteria bacterium]